MKTTSEYPHFVALLLLATGMLASFLVLTTTAKAQETGSDRLFQQRCGSCHSLQAGQNGIGPHLADVIGRTAGSVESARYSDAMRDSGIVWNNRSLDMFLAAPHELVPGTRMTVTVPDANQRAAIIDYLENQ